MNHNDLYTILESGSKEELTLFLNENNLEIKNDKIVHKNKNFVDLQIEYWDKRQLVKKINLNS